MATYIYAPWEQHWKMVVIRRYNTEGYYGPDSLQLLSTSRATTLKWLTSFGDTSAATVLASRFAAQLYIAYPNFRPETIRALIVHSADWTPGMLNNRSISQLSAAEKMKLLQTYPPYELQFS